MAGLSEAGKLNGIVTGVKDHYNEIVKNESASGGESIKPFCVDGAIMQCTMGSAPGKLTVIDHGVAITGKYAAYDEDRVPGTNIPSFGTCAATGKPCAPSPVPKWLLTDEFSLMTNKRGAAATSAENCALITDSILVCMQGGIIKFVTSGQMMTATDLLALLETLLFLMAKQMNALQKQKIASQGEAYVKKPAYTGGDDFISPEAEAKMREELKRDIETLRQIAAKIDKTWDNVTLTDEEIRENYEHNLKLNLKSVKGATDPITGHIINQGMLTDFRYGSLPANRNSCGVISTYNALLTLGESPNFTELLHEYESMNATVLGGTFGTFPGDVNKYFWSHGYSVDLGVTKSQIKKTLKRQTRI